MTIKEDIHDGLNYIARSSRTPAARFMQSTFLGVSAFGSMISAAFGIGDSAAANGTAAQAAQLAARNVVISPDTRKAGHLAGSMALAVDEQVNAAAANPIGAVGDASAPLLNGMAGNFAAGTVSAGAVASTL